MIEAYVNWSIYVRNSNGRKLLEAHLPPIIAALEPLEFEWEIRTEDENPGQFRLINYQNIREQNVEDAVLFILRRAYRLADGWRISGLNALLRGEISHVYGHWKNNKPGNRAPALEDVLFEVEPGQTSGPTGGGAWQIVEPPMTKTK